MVGNLAVADSAIFIHAIVGVGIGTRWVVGWIKVQVFNSWASRVKSSTDSIILLEGMGPGDQGDDCDCKKNDVGDCGTDRLGMWGSDPSAWCFAHMCLVHLPLL